MEYQLVAGMNLAQINAKRYSKMKSKPEPIYLSYLCPTYEICCSPIRPTGSSNELLISLIDIKEIRAGKSSRDFDHFKKEMKKVDAAKCFVLLYGNEFRLKTLSIETSTEAETEAWLKGLNLIFKGYFPDYQSQIYDIWILREFQLFSNNHKQNGFVQLKHFKEFTNKISIKMSTGELKAKFEQHKNAEILHGINFTSFAKLTQEILHDQQIFTDIFFRYTMKNHLRIKEFQEFLKNEQNEEFDPRNFIFFRDYEQLRGNGLFSSEGHYITDTELVDYLFSDSNEIYNPKYTYQTQSMDLPLSQYWISSSHNTYLLGDQVSSESSLEAYARSLRQGCRSVELDVFDGPDNIPIIYHGRTLTTKICFLQVIRTIKEHAFVASEYPLTLSIENHCSLKGQKYIAKKLQEEFGRMLVTKPLSKNETRLPSPEDLKRRILIKCKRLPRDNEKSEPSYFIPGTFPQNNYNMNMNMSSTSQVCQERLRSSGLDLDLDQTIKSGKMYLKNNNDKWEPHFFALTEKKLFHAEIIDQRQSDSENIYDTKSMQELHFYKKWYHGKYQDIGRCGERIKDCGIEGCFLVRDSNNFPGEYSLDFFSNNKVHHVRIGSKIQDGKKLYFLMPKVCFDSVYLLIEHYRKNPLETKDFTVERFTKVVPLPEPHLNQPWFYEEIDRAGAEELLKKIPINGAFLIRYSSERTDGRFVITFRYDNFVKHGLVKEDGRLQVVNSQRFGSIFELVNYYQKHDFYKNMKLKHPVNEKLLAFSKTLDVPNEKIYAENGYTDIVNTKNGQAIALQDYHSNDPELLYFSKGDEICNLVKEEEDWWRGDLGKQIQKFFPSNMVQESNNSGEESLFGTSSRQNGSLNVGKASIVKNVDQVSSHEFPCILTIEQGKDSPIREFRTALNSYHEAKDWMDAINNTFKEIQTDIRISKKLKIAKELSRLIVYLSSVPRIKLSPVGNIYQRTFNETMSLNEDRAEKLLSSDPTYFVFHHQVQLTRVFPRAQRIESSNFNPIKFWNLGVQSCALNWQYPDKSLQLNHGRFRMNGGTGYVLKPDFLFQKDFDPTNKSLLAKFEIKPYNLSISIIAARLLMKNLKGILSPLVEIEISGCDFDCQKFRTKFVHDNGFNPYWINQKFTMKVCNPELALISFRVLNEDSFGDSNFIAQATYPITCLRQGYRSVGLQNGFGERYIPSSLLVHLKIS